MENSDCLNINPQWQPTRKSRQAQKMACMFLLLVFVSLAGYFLVLVYQSIQYEPQPTFIPMPSLPAELESLPRRAHVICNLESSIPSNLHRHYVFVFQYPGIPSGGDSSEFRADSGRRFGKFYECTEVNAIKFSWSDIGGEFWVWIQPLKRSWPETDREHWRTIESEQKAGWIRFANLDFR